ncbi:N/A [soil metagenome]
MFVSSASFAYPEVDGAARAEMARVLLGADVPPSAFVLATCLRVEVVLAGEESELKGVVADLFGTVDVEPRVRSGAEATAHLFRVAAGLESPITGEIEILSQFRESLATLKQGVDVDGGFLRLFEGAVAVGREARRLLDPSPHDTMAAVATQMVGSSPEVAVLGSGTMSAAVVSALLALPAPPRVVVLARTPDKVSIHGVEVWPLARLEEVVGAFPAVISATTASSGLIDRASLSRAVGGRADRLLLVDLAMPPDFPTAPTGLVDYLGIDDVAAIANRRTHHDGARSFVAEAAAEAHHRYRDSHQIGPVIADLIHMADDVVTEVVDRFAGRLTDTTDRAILHQVAHTVARRILARPVAAVRRARDPRVAEVISAAFDTDD